MVKILLLCYPTESTFEFDLFSPKQQMISTIFVQKAEVVFTFPPSCFYFKLSFRDEYPKSIRMPKSGTF